MTLDVATAERLVRNLNSSDQQAAERAAADLDDIIYPKMRGIYTLEQSNVVSEQHFAPLRGSDALSPLVSALNRGTAYARSYAAQTLSLIGDRRCLPLLFHALNEPDSQIRSAAARALIYLPDLRALDSLVTLLGDSETEVVVNASRAIGRLRAVSAVEPLLDLSHSDDWERRACAIYALGNILDTKVLPRIRDALKDKHKRVREAAKSALATFDLARREEAEPSNAPEPRSRAF